MDPRLSMTKNISYYLLCICIQAYGFLNNFSQTENIPVIDAGINSFRIFRRHPPEGILDDDRVLLFIAHHFLSHHCQRLNCTGFHKKLCVSVHLGSFYRFAVLIIDFADEAIMR